MGQVAKWGLRTATVATLIGIYQFNTNDIGTVSLYCFFRLVNLITLFRSHRAHR